MMYEISAGEFFTISSIIASNVDLFSSKLEVHKASHSSAMADISRKGADTNFVADALVISCKAASESIIKCGCVTRKDGDTFNVVIVKSDD